MKKVFKIAIKAMSVVELYIVIIVALINIFK